ncbi:MAG TPA: GAF domain-containing protein, partial [Candidatus Sulfotelmatobacter sp.]|nr:GAF domain-containing protein [Candidatus Sulfotelmatobacter sp.]
MLTAVTLLILQIPVTRYLFAVFLQESLWHFHLVITFLAIGMLLAYRYGFRGGLISSLLSTVIVALVELVHFGATNRHIDVHMTVTIAIATLATGIVGSVAVGLLAHILHTQRKWLEALFASASDGLVVINRDRRILAMNPAAQQISGWNEDDLASAGGCATLFGCGGDQNRCPGNHSTCPVSLSGNPVTNVETEIVHRSGSMVPVSLGSSPVELPLIVWRRAVSSAVVLTIRDIATARRLQAEMDGLAKVCSDISSLSNVTQILQEIASRARSILGADLAVIALADGQDQRLTVQHAAGSEPEQVIGVRVSSGEGILGRAHRVGTPIVIRHVADDLSYPPDKDPYAKETGLLSHVAVPFGGAVGSAGVIAVGWHQPRVILPNQVAVVRQLANLAGVALENSCLLGQIQRRRHEAEALYQLGLEIAALSDFDHKLESVLEQTRLLVNADVTALWAVEEGESLGAWTVVSAADPDAARDWLSRSGQGLVAEVVQAGRVLKLEHLTAPTGLRTPPADRAALGQFRAAVALPLRVRGKTTGALFAGYCSRASVDEDSVLLLSG